MKFYKKDFKENYKPKLRVQPKPDMTRDKAKLNIAPKSDMTRDKAKLNIAPKPDMTRNKPNLKIRSEEEEVSVDELFNPNGEFGGDKPVIAHTQITTNTQKSFDDESDFEEDIPQTTDDFASKTKNKHNWYGTTNMGMPYGGGASGVHENEDLSETKRKIKKSIQELISKRDERGGIVNKERFSDVNRNNIPDIEELTNNIIISKTKDFIKSIKSNGVDNESLGIIFNHLINNLNLSEIPTDYKRLIKNNIK